MTVARLWLAPVGETVFPPRARFFRSLLRAGGNATAPTTPEEKQRGNLPVSPYALSPAHRLEVGR
jgi:hypothetical protein